MIAKCVVVLAIVAQISAELYGSSCGSSQILSDGVSLRSGAQTSQTRNIVARGKYPIALENPGPALDGRIPVTSSHVQTPVQEKPTVRLPAHIPCQKTVAHSCTCYKTIVRPRVHQQVITVPSVQRYIETRHTPVVENIHYEAIPVNSPDVFVTGIENGCGSSFATSQAPVLATAQTPLLASAQSPVLAVATPVIAAAAPIATYSSNCNCY